MSGDIVLGIVDLCSCWVSFEDFESGKHNSTRRRSNGGENAVITVGDVHTGGKGAFTQWAHCEFIVGFETIRPANTHWANCEQTP